MLTSTPILTNEQTGTGNCLSNCSKTWQLTPALDCLGNLFQLLFESQAPSYTTGGCILASIARLLLHKAGRKEGIREEAFYRRESDKWLSNERKTSLTSDCFSKKLRASFGFFHQVEITSLLKSNTAASLWIPADTNRHKQINSLFPINSSVCRTRTYLFAASCWDFSKEGILHMFHLENIFSVDWFGVDSLKILSTIQTL